MTAPSARRISRAVERSVLPSSRTKVHVYAAVGLTIVIAGGWAVTRAVWWAQQRPIRDRSAKWPVAAAIAVGVAGAFFVVRPYVSTARANPTSGGAYYVGAVQRYLGMPVDQSRSYYEQSLRWLSWYLGWATLALALLGAMWLAYNVTNSENMRYICSLLVINFNETTLINLNTCLISINSMAIRFAAYSY